MKRVGWIALLLLAGCQPGVMTWEFSKDGGLVSRSPALMTQFNRDRAICDGEAAKAGLAYSRKDLAAYNRGVSLVFYGCMVEKGYTGRQL